MMGGGYPNRQNLWPKDLKTTPPGVRPKKKKKVFWYGEERTRQKETGAGKQGKGWSNQPAGQRVFDAEASTLSGEVVQGLGEGEGPHQVWLVSILFWLISGDERFSQLFTEQRMGSWRVCVWLSQVNKGAPASESYLGHQWREVSLQWAHSGTQKDKGFLMPVVFLDLRALQSSTLAISISDHKSYVRELKTPDPYSMKNLC